MPPESSVGTQVGKGIAGAGHGHQRQVAGYRRGDALRHLQLLGSRTKAGHGSGERPLGGEDAVKDRWHKMLSGDPETVAAICL